MKCYFATSELNCPGDTEWARSNPEFILNSSLSKPNGNVVRRCPSIVGPQAAYNEEMLQLATIESLFTHVTPKVQQEATRQLNLVFQGQTEIPKDLITVHIRWGDKVETFRNPKRTRYAEMKKVEISDYIDAVQQILLDKRRRHRHQKYIQKQGNDEQKEMTANIYLATEDPAAVKEFKKAMPTGWNLFVDRFLSETQSHRVHEYNASPKLAQSMNGKAGLLALGSLLVAMESNDYVLTTESNWSQLMDEIRRSIIDPRCDGCTTAIDLRKKKSS
jgi:hypothetical protein